MIRRTFRLLAIIGILFAESSALRAGTNTWTGGSPTAMYQTPSRVAADPSDPYVVYGVFAGNLYRSSDGGRTWNELRSVSGVGAILVHPAAPSTIYVSGYDPSLAFNSYSLFKSTDAGQTWTRVFEQAFITALAGSPSDASTVFACTVNQIHKTTDGGATWVSALPISGVIGDLVIHPRKPAVAYASAEGFDYWGITPGSLVKTTDGGASWQDTAPKPLESSTAVAIDPASESTVFAAVGPYTYANSATPPTVLRSDDGGATWTSATAGLPRSIVRHLVVDPRVAKTLYAGTETGLYRTRDGGGSWTPFGQRLAGVSITSLAIDKQGRFLHAGTYDGVYDIEVAEGPLDVAAGPGGESRFLVIDADRFAVGTLDASGSWKRASFEDASAIWTATAIAAAPGDRTHVLWLSGDGRSGLEIVGSAGRQSSTVFATIPGWIASDLSVRADGRTSVLWTGAGGTMRIATVDSSGAATLGPEYGPAISWSAVAIADGPAGDTWVLWRSTDGRAGLSLHRDGAMESSSLWAADLAWTAEDIAVGADGRPRLLRTGPDGTAEVSTVDAAGRLAASQIYSINGLTPRRIATGADGRTRLLFGAADGQGSVFLLKADNTESARYAIPAER